MSKLLMFIFIINPFLLHTRQETFHVGLIFTGEPNDHGFNEYSLKGVQTTAEEFDFEFFYLIPDELMTPEEAIENLIGRGANIVITVGFQMGRPTAEVARVHPDIWFITVDTDFAPGAGCPDTADNCYTEEGGLVNVTSLLFAEDEVGYLAGVLAACMTETNVIASVAGRDIPPVVRFVEGYQAGAKSYNPEIIAFNEYIQNFNDPFTGQIVALDFIKQESDVIFAVAGITGNGALMAAKESKVMAIGVDVDQYYTFPEVKDTLITSAIKQLDVAVADALRAFFAEELQAGVRISDLKNGGVALAPFHDWEDLIPQDCKVALQTAEAAVIADPTITGAKESID